MSDALIPGDPADDALRSHVRPDGWVNPTPAKVYNLVAVGAGATGLVAAGGVGGLGGKAALVERNLLGGECLNVGCVPSKALLAAAKASHAARSGDKFGVHPRGCEVDFSAVMRHVRHSRAALAPNDAAAKFRDKYGVDVFFGDARFTGPDTLTVAGQTLHFRRALIATGSRPTVPDIPGLNDAGFLTNETVFTLTDLPARLVVLGAGPVGCELAQAFARLGSRVTLVASGPQLLPKEEPAAAELLLTSLRADGIDVRLGAKAERVEPLPTGPRIHLSGGTAVDADRVLVAAGRTPAVDNLGLDAAGVAFDPKHGVLVTDTLRTSNPHIYAAGDIAAGGLKFTHAADATARLALRNALFLGRGQRSALTIPWCTFTDPEIARVGLSESEAKERHEPVTVLHLDYADLDRAVTESAAGFAHLLITPGTGRIVGATIAGPAAGELIGAVSLVMTHNIGLNKLAGTIFPYPTYTEALKKLADQHNRGRLTPLVAAVLRTWLRWRR